MGERPNILCFLLLDQGIQTSNGEYIHKDEHVKFFQKATAPFLDDLNIHTFDSLYSEDNSLDDLNAFLSKIMEKIRSEDNTATNIWFHMICRYSEFEGASSFLFNHNGDGVTDRGFRSFLKYIPSHMHVVVTVDAPRSSKIGRLKYHYNDQNFLRPYLHNSESEIHVSADVFMLAAAYEHEPTIGVGSFVISWDTDLTNQTSNEWYDKTIGDEFDKLVKNADGATDGLDGGENVMLFTVLLLRSMHYHWMKDGALPTFPLLFTRLSYMHDLCVARSDSIVAIPNLSGESSPSFVSANGTRNRLPVLLTERVLDIRTRVFPDTTTDGRRPSVEFHSSDTIIESPTHLAMPDYDIDYLMTKVRLNNIASLHCSTTEDGISEHVFVSQENLQSVRNYAYLFMLQRLNLDYDNILRTDFDTLYTFYANAIQTLDYVRSFNEFATGDPNILRYDKASSAYIIGGRYTLDELKTIQTYPNLLDEYTYVSPCNNFSLCNDFSLCNQEYNEWLSTYNEQMDIYNAVVDPESWFYGFSNHTVEYLDRVDIPSTSFVASLFGESVRNVNMNDWLINTKLHSFDNCAPRSFRFVSTIQTQTNQRFLNFDGFVYVTGFDVDTMFTPSVEFSIEEKRTVYLGIDQNDTDYRTTTRWNEFPEEFCLKIGLENIDDLQNPLLRNYLRTRLQLFKVILFDDKTPYTFYVKDAQETLANTLDTYVGRKTNQIEDRGGKVFGLQWRDDNLNPPSSKYRNYVIKIRMKTSNFVHRKTLKHLFLHSTLYPPQRSTYALSQYDFEYDKSMIYHNDFAKDRLHFDDLFVSNPNEIQFDSDYTDILSMRVYHPLENANASILTTEEFGVFLRCVSNCFVDVLTGEESMEDDLDLQLHMLKKVDIDDMQSDTVLDPSSDNITTIPNHSFEDRTLHFHTRLDNVVTSSDEPRVASGTSDSINDSKYVYFKTSSSSSSKYLKYLKYQFNFPSENDLTVFNVSSYTYFSDIVININEDNVILEWHVDKRYQHMKYNVATTSATDNVMVVLDDIQEDFTIDPQTLTYNEVENKITVEDAALAAPTYESKYLFEHNTTEKVTTTDKLNDIDELHLIVYRGFLFNTSYDELTLPNLELTKTTTGCIVTDALYWFNSNNDYEDSKHEYASDLITVQLYSDPPNTTSELYHELFTIGEFQTNSTNTSEVTLTLTGDQQEKVRVRKDSVDLFRCDGFRESLLQTDDTTVSDLIYGMTSYGFSNIVHHNQFDIRLDADFGRTEAHSFTETIGDTITLPSLTSMSLHSTSIDFDTPIAYSSDIELDYNHYSGVYRVYDFNYSSSPTDEFYFKLESTNVEFYKDRPCRFSQYHAKTYQVLHASSNLLYVKTNTNTDSISLCLRANSIPVSTDDINYGTLSVYPDYNEKDVSESDTFPFETV